MSIVFDENLLAVWFVQLSPSSDFSAGFSKRDDGRYEFISRFHYYVNDKTVDIQARKNWYRMVSKPGVDEQEAFRIAKDAVQLLIDKSGGAHHELLRGSMTFDEFVHEFMKLPFIHARTAQAFDYKMAIEGESHEYPVVGHC